MRHSLGLTDYDDVIPNECMGSQNDIVELRFTGTSKTDYSSVGYCTQSFDFLITTVDMNKGYSRDTIFFEMRDCGKGWTYFSGQWLLRIPPNLAVHST